MPWMMVTFNKIKHMALHRSHAAQIKSSKTVAQNYSSVSNEIGSILVTCFLGSKFWKTDIQTFESLPNNTVEKEKKEKQKEDLSEDLSICTLKNLFEVSTFSSLMAINEI